MRTKNITLFTPVGHVGRKIAEEALSRGHGVKVVVSDKAEFNLKHPNLSIMSGNIHSSEEVSTCAKGSDLVIFVNELKENREGECFNATRSILTGIKQAGIKFLIVSGYGLHFDPTISEAEQETWSAVEEEQLASIRLLEREPEIRWRYFYITTQEPGQNNYIPVRNTNFVLNMPCAEDSISIDEYATTIMEEVEKHSKEKKYKEAAILSNSFHNNRIYNNLN